MRRSPSAHRRSTVGLRTEDRVAPDGTGNGQLGLRKSPGPPVEKSVKEGRGGQSGGGIATCELEMRKSSRGRPTSPGICGKHAMAIVVNKGFPDESVRSWESNKMRSSAVSPSRSPARTIESWLWLMYRWATYRMKDGQQQAPTYRYPRHDKAAHGASGLTLRPPRAWLRYWRVCVRRRGCRREAATHLPESSKAAWRELPNTVAA